MSDEREYFSFLTLQFDVTRAKALVADRPVNGSVDPMKFAGWVGLVSIDVEHAHSDKVDTDKPIICVLLPRNRGYVPIDGNHRIYRAIHDRRARIPAHVLTLAESKQVCTTHTMWRNLENSRTDEGIPLCTPSSPNAKRARKRRNDSKG